jgi:hypothetical protein
MIDAGVTGDDGGELMQEVTPVGFQSRGLMGNKNRVFLRADGGLFLSAGTFQNEPVIAAFNIRVAEKSALAPDTLSAGCLAGDRPW